MVIMPKASTSRTTKRQLFSVQYDPARRLTAAEALCHPFLEPLFPWRCLVPAPAREGADAKAKRKSEEEGAPASIYI